GVDVDHRTFELEELVEAHFGHEDLRAETHLRHTALNRHLAAFEADLVVAALARALTLHATAAGLALAGGSAAAHAAMHLAGAGSEFHVVETHSHVSCPLILPAFGGKLNRQQVLGGADHSAVFRRVGSLYRLVTASQAE